MLWSQRLQSARDLVDSVAPFWQVVGVLIRLLLKDAFINGFPKYATAAKPVVPKVLNDSVHPAVQPGTGCPQFGSGECTLARLLNLASYAMPMAKPSGALTVIGVVGASMNAGKTSAVASLVHGLEGAGYRTAAIKVTGTGAFGDWNAYEDAGASFVTDFTDVGMVSTYLQPIDRLQQALQHLLGAAEQAACEVAVVEFADGVLQRETAALLDLPEVRSKFAGFLYATPDALAAVGGQLSLERLGIRPVALTGLISASPLNALEAQAATGLPVLAREALRDPAQTASLLHSLSTEAVAC